MRYEIGVQILLLYLVIALLNCIEIALLWGQTMQDQKCEKRRTKFFNFILKKTMNNLIIVLTSSSDQFHQKSFQKYFFMFLQINLLFLIYVYMYIYNIIFYFEVYLKLCFMIQLDLSGIIRERRQAMISLLQSCNYTTSTELVRKYAKQTG